MSWLARSIANSLRIDDDGDEDDDDSNHNTPSPKCTQSEYDLQEHEEVEEEDRADNQGRGVKEDLSEFKETLTRQLRGVASFLAPRPPPPPPPTQSSATSYQHADRSVSDRGRWESSGHSDSDDISYEDASDSVGIFETRNDFAGRFQTGISYLSDNRAVWEISKMPTNFLPFGSGDQIGDAVGITDEVLAFARNIAHHPETWLDFPLSEEEDMDDFDISDAQHEHALAVECLAPRLAALRIELCPYHMSDGYFWMVYFVLLHSRLNKHDAELLSTPQIVGARAMWMQELQKRTKPEADWFGRSTSYLKESDNSLQDDYGADSFDYTPSGNMSSRAFPFEHENYPVTTEFETEKHPVVSTEIQVIDKSVIEEEPVKKTEEDFVAGPSYNVPVQNYEDDEDDWLKDNSELDGYTATAIFVGNEEDVSFSDLEDDDDCIVPIKSKIVTKGLDTSTRTS
ncbi:hypothetical protein F0562_027551 [Nyssa sinensis]|uniref:BSD domain-containing protein n=1 Tax=Nyssa sinensis TaxID=561372 RepID=A0A5J5B598_9ASTE|nr:hypothetical protein F0562_027551 [Nyssa sinensis]